MLKDFGERLESAVLDGIGRASSRVQERRPLPADLLESDDAYLAVFDAPGATAADVEVRFDDNAVTVRVDRFREYYEEFDMRLAGRGLSLAGSVTLPPEADVDPERAEATVTGNGTLQVRIPKVAGSEGRDVAVTDESDEDEVAVDDAGSDATSVDVGGTGEDDEDGDGDDEDDEA
jgi:HSP20 family molecular chaperone IbpA